LLVCITIYYICLLIYWFYPLPKFIHIISVEQPRRSKSTKFSTSFKTTRIVFY